MGARNQTSLHDLQRIWIQCGKSPIETPFLLYTARINFSFFLDQIYQKVVHSIYYDQKPRAHTGMEKTQRGTGKNQR